MKASAIGFNAEYAEDAPTYEDICQLTDDIILEFGAPWCGHCQAARSGIKAELDGRSIPHIKVSDGKGKKLGRKFGVKLWPTLILLRNGIEVRRIVRPLLKQEINDFLTR